MVSEQCSEGSHATVYCGCGVVLLGLCANTCVTMCRSQGRQEKQTSHQNSNNAYVTTCRSQGRHEKQTSNQQLTNKLVNRQRLKHWFLLPEGVYQQVLWLHSSAMRATMQPYNMVAEQSSEGYMQTHTFRLAPSKHCWGICNYTEINRNQESQEPPKPIYR